MPVFCQPPPRDGDSSPGEEAQKVSKVSSAGAGEDTGDVLPDDPAGAKALSQADIFKRKVAARIIQSETLSRDGE